MINFKICNGHSSGNDLYCDRPYNFNLSLSRDDSEDSVHCFNTALSVQRDFDCVKEESWSDRSSGDMHAIAVKLSPVFPHRRFGNTVGCCSAISRVYTCNFQLFYDDFSCVDNNQSIVQLLYR